MTTARKTPIKKAAAKKAPAKKAAAAKKAAPAKPAFTPPKGPLAVLDEDAAKFLASAVMSHPGGCRSGKQSFIKRLGLPDPDPTATFQVSLVLSLPNASDVVADRSCRSLSDKKVRVATAEATCAAIQAALSTIPNLTVNIEEPSFIAVDRT